MVPVVLNFARVVAKLVIKVVEETVVVQWARGADWHFAVTVVCQDRRCSEDTV